MLRSIVFTFSSSLGRILKGLIGFYFIFRLSLLNLTYCLDYHQRTFFQETQLLSKLLSSQPKLAIGIKDLFDG